jgi:hypothetical protein
LLLENTVLLYEIANDCLLAPTEPAGQGDYEEAKRLYGVCHRTNKLDLILFVNNTIQLDRVFAPYGQKKHKTELAKLAFETDMKYSEILAKVVREQP